MRAWRDGRGARAIDAYRTTRRAPAPQGQGLNDLYVRFFRMAERRIVEKTGKGIVCFISNYSWLDGLSFTGMRERYLEVFDRIWIDCLNGDKYKTGKLTPEASRTRASSRQSSTAKASRSVRPSRCSCGGAQPATPRREFRELWGEDKRESS